MRERRYIVIKREVPECRPARCAKNFAPEISVGFISNMTPRASSEWLHALSRHRLLRFPEHRGIQGVEASMEEYLHGQDGYATRTQSRRSGNRPYRGRNVARDGYQSTSLSILTCRTLSKMNIDTRWVVSPQCATIILMRLAATGEILAMANRPISILISARSEARGNETRAIIDDGAGFHSSRLWLQPRRSMNTSPA
jgi:hypothetical protein